MCSLINYRLHCQVSNNQNTPSKVTPTDGFVHCFASKLLPSHQIAFILKLCYLRHPLHISAYYKHCIYQLNVKSYVSSSWKFFYYSFFFGYIVFWQQFWCWLTLKPCSVMPTWSLSPYVTKVCSGYDYKDYCLLLWSCAVNELHCFWKMIHCKRPIKKRSACNCINSKRGTDKLNVYCQSRVLQHPHNKMCYWCTIRTTQYYSTLLYCKRSQQVTKDSRLVGQGFILQQDNEPSEQIYTLVSNDWRPEQWFRMNWTES